MSEEESAPKKPKLTDEEVPDPKQVAVASTSRDEPKPNIFKLDIDCFDEIFEYLSFKDLHSFGQTCKTMQQVAGEYFKKNYSTIPTYVKNDDDIYAYVNHGMRRISLSNFNQFITRIENRSNDSKPFNSIWNLCEFNSLRYIGFFDLDFDKGAVEDFRNVWRKVETIDINFCDIKDDLHEICLKHCDNLKRLFLRYNKWPEPNPNIQAPWFQREYPQLDFLELRPIQSMDQLSMLLQNNPSLKRLTVSATDIGRYQHEFMQLNIQLDLLELTYWLSVLFIDEVIMILNSLYDRGFYKRLHLDHVDEISISSLASLSGLQGVFIFNFNTNINLSPLINLRELAIFNGAIAAEMEILAKRLVNLERLYICRATIDDIMPFIRQTKTLAKIKIDRVNEANFNGGFLKLHAMNKEREKLFEARKITIYVPDNVFLKTKWTTKNGDTNLSLIEMKRLESYEWNPQF